MAIGGVVLLLAAVALLAYRPATSARTHLLLARDAMLEGREALLRGDADAASEDFLLAKSEFIRAGTQARHPVLVAIGWLPWIGRTPDAVSALADAGGVIADAGDLVADAIGSLPGGASALAPADGRIDLDAMPVLAQAVDDAAARTRSAIALLDGAPGSLLLGPVADARVETLEQLESLHETLDRGAGLLRSLPGFLGGDGPRRYFFGAVNPSELRGSGGFLGAYSILTVDDGEISFAPFRTILDLPSFDLDEVEPPSADYARNYDVFGGAAFWQNVNMTPDFPSAAVAIERLYARGTGEVLDGVIVADPFVLEALLRATGPVEVPELGRTLSAEDVVAYTANEAYSEFRDQTGRKEALGDAAKAVFEGFMEGRGSPLDGAMALALATADGHLSVYVNDPAVQDALRAADVAGALEAPPGDVLSVVQNNAAGNKVDYYLERTVSYMVQLGAQGQGVADLALTLRNEAPLEGASSYVLGPHPGASARGEHVGYTTVYCAASCQLQSATRDGVEEAQQVGSELGFTTLRDYVELSSGSSTALDYRLGLPEGWEGDDNSGFYRLTFLNQSTIRPTRLTVDVQVPEGMSIVWSNVPVVASGGHARWSGVPGRRFELEVRFERPWPSRLWTSAAWSGRP